MLNETREREAELLEALEEKEDMIGELRRKLAENARAAKAEQVRSCAARIAATSMRPVGVTPSVLLFTFPLSSLTTELVDNARPSLRR
jgi:DNA-binding protein H-NS